MLDGVGYVSMSKRFFWPMFQRAWDKAFTKGNIQSAQAKSGLWPTNSDDIIKKIAPPIQESPKKEDRVTREPKSAKSIRQFKLNQERDPTTDKINILFTTTLKLSAESHQNQGLHKAIEL